MDEILPRKIWQEIGKYLSSPQAIVITGIRRSGKTSLLRYIFEKVPSENKLFLDLENPLTRRLFEELNYEMIKTNLEKQGVSLSAKCYLFLDEIQWLRQIPSIVKYLIDHYQVKFFLTGSASFYLKNLFSESLAGRKFIFELYPLSFEEFLFFKKVRMIMPEPGQPVTEITWKTIEPYWQEYLAFGGFPEVVLAQNPGLKTKLLEEIFTSYFQKEIEQLADFRKTDLIRNFIILLAQNSGNLVNIQRFASELKVSRLTLEEWLYFLRATYLVELIPPYSQTERAAIRKAKKIYFVDWGLLSRIGSISSGQRLENCIFHLLRLKGQLSYYQKKSGVEIDFILNKETAFEVKSTAGASDQNLTRRLAKEIGLKSAYLVTEKYSPGNLTVPGFSLG